jgi:hypothetical protein
VLIGTGTSGSSSPSASPPRIARSLSDSLTTSSSSSHHQQHHNPPTLVSSSGSGGTASSRLAQHRARVTGLQRRAILETEAKRVAAEHRAATTNQSLVGRGDDKDAKDGGGTSGDDDITTPTTVTTITAPIRKKMDKEQFLRNRRARDGGTSMAGATPILAASVNSIVANTNSSKRRRDPTPTTPITPLLDDETSDDDDVNNTSMEHHKHELDSMVAESEKRKRMRSMGAAAPIDQVSHALTQAGPGELMDPNSIMGSHTNDDEDEEERIARDAALETVIDLAHVDQVFESKVDDHNQTLFKVAFHSKHARHPLAWKYLPE